MYENHGRSEGFTNVFGYVSPASDASTVSSIAAILRWNWAIASARTASSENGDVEYALSTELVVAIGRKKRTAIPESARNALVGIT